MSKFILAFLLRERRKLRVKKYISKQKLTKKTQKALNREKRVEWAFRPVSRVIPNKKKDAQKKLRPEDTDSGWSFF